MPLTRPRGPLLSDAVPAPAVVTPDGVRRVEVITTRAGQVFRIRRRTLIGSSRGWAATGKVRFSVAEVREMLGDAFGHLVDA